MNNSIGAISVGVITKLSSSNIKNAVRFYTNILGFVVDERYTINVQLDFENNSYVQLYLPGAGSVVIGLFKDIDQPFSAFDVNQPPTGTAPTLVVSNIDKAISCLKANGTMVGEKITSTSDKGFTDVIAFFPDPDNNMLVIRQNIMGNSY